MKDNKEEVKDHNVIDKDTLPNPVSIDNDLHIKDEVFEDDNTNDDKEKEDSK